MVVQREPGPVSGDRCREHERRWGLGGRRRCGSATAGLARKLRLTSSKAPCEGGGDDSDSGEVLWQGGFCGFTRGAKVSGNWFVVMVGDGRGVQAAAHIATETAATRNGTCTPAPVLHRWPRVSLFTAYCRPADVPLYEPVYTPHDVAIPGVLVAAHCSCHACVLLACR